jgi:pyruvate dehydrogenase E2 component (dihydrolipoamide acetyltransferase)
MENFTLNDMVVWAVSRTLSRHPDLNAHFLDDTMRHFAGAHIGVAVDTERGLMVPTVFDADRKSLEEISREIKALAAACQKGNVALDALKGASFTITNLGIFGVESFTPVINPPQTGILGVDTIVTRPRQGAAGVEFYPAMGLSLTFDHRAVDGAPAARFLQDLKNMLENFTVLMAR